MAAEELDGVDEARVEATRPPHPRRAHAATRGRELGHVAGRGQGAEVMLLVMVVVPAVAAERVSEHAVEVEPAGARQHPVVRGRRERRRGVGCRGCHGRGRRRGAQGRGPRRGVVGVVEPDLWVALAVVSGA